MPDVAVDLLVSIFAMNDRQSNALSKGTSKV
jgi:hypothetical protein